MSFTPNLLLRWIRDEVGLGDKRPRAVYEAPRRPRTTLGPSLIAAATYILDGKAISEAILTRVAEEARAVAGRGVTPGLAVVLVGADPAARP